MKRDRYFYIIRILHEKENLYKYGYTKDTKRRLKEHARTYGVPVAELWVSEVPTTEQAARNNEARVRKQLARLYKAKHIPRDRFLLDGDIKELKLSIRSETRIDFTISL